MFKSNLFAANHFAPNHFSHAAGIIIIVQKIYRTIVKPVNVGTLMNR